MEERFVKKVVPLYNFMCMVDKACHVTSTNYMQYKTKEVMLYVSEIQIDEITCMFKMYGE